MSPAPGLAPAVTDSDRVARARERFLATQSVAPNQVRETILASWWRSLRWKLTVDRIEPSYIREPELDTPLTRSALPVLRSLREHLDGQAISVVLTDPTGLVLSRLAADRDLDRHLDSLHLAPGFSYAEKFVGTNGIGTALERGMPMHVFGHEHYAEHLENLACAAAPIRHPISGKTVGVVDLTCWRKDADRLLIALAKATADQITRALLTSSTAHEFELLQEYLRASRRTAGIVLALSPETVMLNEHAREVLEPADQAVLIGHAAKALCEARPLAVGVELPSGVRARIHVRPLRDGTRPGEGIVHVKLLRPGRGQPAEKAPRPRMVMPGLVGTGSLWLRGCDELDVAFSAGEWLALDGEPGVGKLAAIQAVHQRSAPARRCHVLDAATADSDWLAEARRELLDGEGSLVIRHVDRLGARQLPALSAALRETMAAGRQNSLWVAVTLNHPSVTQDLATLLRFFPSTIELPPLRHHIEDINELVPFFLARLSQSGTLSCSPEAMQLLLHATWPGNTEQLWQVLRQVVRHRRTGTILPKDLPPECWAVSRRVLRPLEAMERDAIVQSLLDFDGNKVKAADSLGMSRATIYRKIHEYGIVARRAERYRHMAGAAHGRTKPAQPAVGGRAT